MSGQRPRIIKNLGETTFDKDAFTENCSTENARKQIEFTENLKTELWIDKHYWNYITSKEREGIELEFTEPLITKSLKHLLYYSLKLKEFNFVNHPPKQMRNIRVVLRQLFKTKLPLNVTVECHFINLNIFEVTIITAMSVENFKLSDGQYLIEFNDLSSTLYSFKTRQLKEIDSYSE